MAKTFFVDELPSSIKQRVFHARTDAILCVKFSGLRNISKDMKVSVNTLRKIVTMEPVTMIVWQKLLTWWESLDWKIE